MRYYKDLIRYSCLSLALGSLVLGGVACSKEGLDEGSVLDEGRIDRPRTELDDWIEETFSKPYGIEVVYHWDRKISPPDGYYAPVEIGRVRPVLELVKALWIDLLEDAELGGADYLKGKAPLRLCLVGNVHKDVRGVELVGGASPLAAQIYLYGVNDFDPKDPDKLFIMLRSLYHQWARRLVQLTPYDRDAFVKISLERYLGSTDLLARLRSGYKTSRSFVDLVSYASDRGFYTLHGMLSAEDDFCDMIAMTMLHTPMRIQQILDEAESPDVDEDPATQSRYNEEAKQALAELKAKQELLRSYFRTHHPYSLGRLQSVSGRWIRAYLNE